MSRLKFFFITAPEYRSQQEVTLKIELVNAHPAWCNLGVSRERYIYLAGDIDRRGVNHLNLASNCGWSPTTNRSLQFQTTLSRDRRRIRVAKRP